MSTREAYVTWLADQLKGNLLFLTLTYQQRRIKAGSNFKLDRNLMERQTKWLLIRLDRKLLKRAARRGCKLERLVFHEGKEKRLHTHMVLALPKGIGKQQLQAEITAILEHSDWARPIFDVRECHNLIGLVSYLTKEGTDAFDEENSEFNAL